jgi:hypothetical protein
MRRYLKSTILMALLGFAFGGLYRYLFDPAAEREAANYLRSGVHGSSIAVTAWLVQLYFTSR